MFDFGISLVDLVGDDIAKACSTLAAQTGFDPARNPGFWESFVSVQLGGFQTSHKECVDVDVNIWGRLCRAEVKFSQAFYSKYNLIRGKDWSRYVFKWLLTSPQADCHNFDALILVGMDTDNRIHYWVVSRDDITLGKRSITVTAPSSRLTDTSGKMDDFYVPPSELLPAFARACHNTYDLRHRRANASVSRRARSAQLDIEDALNAG